MFHRTTTMVRDAQVINALENGAPSVRRIEAAEAPAFAAELMSAQRTRPVVAVSTHPRTGLPLVDPVAIAREIGQQAGVVTIETGEATWALSEALPTRLDVYGGAARIWWPGLSAASDPYDHPLFLIYPGEAPAALARVVAAIRRGDVRARRATSAPPQRATATVVSIDRAGPPPVAPVSGRAGPDGQVLDAVVKAIEDERITLDAAGDIGLLVEADVPLRQLALELSEGQRIRVRRIREGDSAEFSLRGVFPDPWMRLQEVYHPGDVVRGRVVRIEPKYVLVEVFPGTALLAPLSELDWRFVQDPARHFKVGERVSVKILALDPERRRGTVSIKQAYGREVLPAVSPGPGQPPFLGEDETLPVRPSCAEQAQTEQLVGELEAALVDRIELMRRLKEANEQLAELRKERRSAEDRFRALEARVKGDLDPGSSETAFLSAVRVEYARRLDEADRARYPLQRMRVGREFLARLRDLGGIEVSKIVEVCAQVACGRAHEIPGRSVHELHAGDTGPGRTRASDGAKAWRCSLQEGTPSARRLHWWEVPSQDGRTIEFASVAVHDDYSIPA